MQKNIFDVCIEMSGHRSRRGSVSVESAIAFTSVFLLIAAIISVINVFRTDILINRALKQSCENISLIYPLSVPAGDWASVVINAFPNVGLSGTKASNIFEKTAAVSGGINSFTGNKLDGMIHEGLLAGPMAKEIEQGYISRNGDSSFMKPSSIDVRFDVNKSSHIIETEVRYKVITMLGPIERKGFCVIPMYGDASLILSPEEDSSADDDIWSLTNFGRGDKIREMYGANLPKLYPVIDYYKSGEAGSILSIDLTAPTYSSNSKIKKAVTKDIDDLAAFDGGSKVINGKKYTVGNIKKKSLKVVIPSNSSAKSKESVEKLIKYASSKGVDMQIVEHGESKKYEK